jgi:hypothetical protein
MAPGLRQAGLVTSALWSDADGDGWLDLLVTCEWGPVRFFANEQGRLIERTREIGLANRLGWWKGIAAGDIDNDGDLDYVVSNLGLNTRYQPSAEEPCLLYYGDFAGTAVPQPIEAQLLPQGVFPTRGLGAFEMVVPKVREKFPTHHAFAAATLHELLGPEKVDAALKLAVNTPESAVLRNNGGRSFSFEVLPRLAQIAPAHGVALADVDGDGHLDLLLAQNFYPPNRETGRMDGGVSLLLMGNSAGSFSPVWPNQSGLLVPGDARSLGTCDLNEDGWLDCVVGVNNGKLHAFENTSPRTNRVLSVRLQGHRGNPTGVGAKVTVQLKNGGSRTAEVRRRWLSFTVGFNPEVRTRWQRSGELVEVRWSQGKVTRHDISRAETTVLLWED